MTCSKPSDYNILTYVIPWVPADLDVDQTHLILRDFWKNTVPGVSLTARIDFVEIPHTDGMHQAFVYHYPCEAAKLCTDIIMTGMRETPSSDLDLPRVYFGSGSERRHLLLLTNTTPTSVVLRKMSEMENDEREHLRCQEENQRWLREHFQM